MMSVRHPFPNQEKWSSKLNMCTREEVVVGWQPLMLYGLAVVLIAFPESGEAEPAFVHHKKFNW